MLVEKIKNEIRKHNIQKAYIMIYFFDQVIIGKYDNNELFIPVQYNEELFQEIHIFNRDIELRWSYLNDYVSVINKSDESNCFEEQMCIIGKKSVIKDGYTIIKQYGRELVLPFEININDNNNLKLIVHHLFSEKDSSVCGYKLSDIKGGE